MLLASIALDVPINVVMRDFVWSTVHDGVDFQYPTVVLTASGAIPCHPLDLEVVCQADVDTSSSTVVDTTVEEVKILSGLLERPTGG